MTAERALLLIRRRRPAGELAATEPDPAPRASLHEGTEGAGRIVLALAALGVEIGDMLQLVVDPEASPADLAALDLGRRFVTVAQGSHLLNLPDPALRRGYLALTRRHLAGDGPGGDPAKTEIPATVLIEHHPVDWLRTAAPTPSTPGVGSQPGMSDVRIEPPFVSATSTYDIGGHEYHVPFRAEVLGDEDIARELAGVGLAMRRRLSETWLEAGPSRPAR